jgi:hypothetical protein
MRRKRGIEKGRTCKISPMTWTSLLLSIVLVEEEKDLEGEVVCVSVSFESIFSTSTSVGCRFKGGSPPPPFGGRRRDGLYLAT